MTRRGVLWAVAALLGIVLTAALTWSVSRIAGQRIGLSYVPVRVIKSLAPAPPRQPAGEHREPTVSSPRATAGTTHAPTRTVVVPSPAIAGTSAAPTLVPVAPSVTRVNPSAVPTPSVSVQTTTSSRSRPQNDDSSGGSRSGTGSPHRDD